MYLHEVWPKVRDWKAIKKARLEYSLHIAHTHTHTHTYTNNAVGRFAFSIIMTSNKSSKKNRAHVSDSFCVLYNLCTPSWNLYLYTSAPSHKVCVVSCLYGYLPLSREYSRGQGVFGAFLHCDNCEKNQHRHLLSENGT